MYLLCMYVFIYVCMCTYVSAFFDLSDFLAGGFPTHSSQAAGGHHQGNILRLDELIFSDFVCMYVCMYLLDNQLFLHFQ